MTTMHANYLLRMALCILAGALCTAFWSLEWAITLWLFSTVCILGFGATYRRAQRIHAKYKGIKVLYLRESDHVWSSHFDGHPWQWWTGLWLRVRGRAPRGIKLLVDKEDKQRLEELAVRAWSNSLESLQHQKDAIIISASVLNWDERSTERLRRRIECVRASAAWNYCVVRRRLTIAETIFGRLLYAWPVREGEHWFRAYAPGVVAYQGKHGLPNLDRYNVTPIPLHAGPV